MHELAHPCLNAHFTAAVVGKDTLVSPAGTDGLNSAGMITGKDGGQEHAREGGREERKRGGYENRNK